MEIKLTRTEVKDILMEHIAKTMAIPKKQLTLIELVPLREVTFVVKEIKVEKQSFERLER